MEARYSESDLMNLTKPELIAIILLQQEAIARLEERVRQLEEIIHKDSHNSHIPPSQSLNIPIKNLREKTGKPPEVKPVIPVRLFKWSTSLTTLSRTR